MRKVAVIQARMTSSRLPGKTMLRILDKPILELMIERIQRAKNISEIVVATSTNRQDDCIVNLCNKLGIGSFRGSEEDVLSRVALASRTFKADILVGFMADNPIPEPRLISEFMDFFEANDYTVVTNMLKTTFTPGLELYVVKSETIYEADRFALAEEEREHVLLYISRNSSKYKIYNVEAPEEYNYPELHMELDAQEDFKLIKNIYENFYPNKKDFSSKEAIAYLRSHPELTDINKSIKRRWEKYRQSL